MKKWIVALFLLPCFVWAAPSAPRFSQVDAEVDSLIVVFKESAVTRSKKDGKSAVERATFWSVGALKKSIRQSVKTTKRSKDGKAELSRAGRNLKNMYGVEIAEGQTVDAAIRELEASPLVEYVEPNYRVYPQAAPTDLLYPEQWSLNNTGQSYYGASGVNNLPPQLRSGTAGADIDWVEAYTNGFPTNEILIAVIDTGVDYTHPDLVNQMWVNPGEIPGNGLDDDNNGLVDDVYGIDALNDDSDPMDDHAHGTHCAGTIAAEVDNVGIAGVNPYARIMACKFLGLEGGGTEDAIACIYYAADMGAKVLNNSWGGGGFSQALQDAITYANEKGCFFMAAAGNSDTSSLSYPAAYDGVTSVAASDSNDEKAGFSNYGFWVDVMAPGVDILSCRTTHPEATRDPNEQYYWKTIIHPNDTNTILFQGTSMACPTAAGAISLLMAQTPGYEPWVYGRVMEASCNADVYTIGTNVAYEGKLGAGRIDVDDMLAYDEAHAFLLASLDVKGGFSGMVLGQGETNGIAAKVGAWEHAMTNLSVHMTVRAEDDDQVSVNVASYSIGNLTAGEVAEVPTDTFVVTIDPDAQMGRWSYILAELKQGDTVLDAMWVYVAVARKTITDFRLADLDLDGIDEMVGYDEDSGSVTAYDLNGNPIWAYEPDGDAWGAISSIAVGDIDSSTPEPEIVLVQNHTNDWWNAQTLHILDADGNHLAGPFRSSKSINRPVLANMDDDEALEVVVTRHYSQWSPAEERNYVEVFDFDGANLTWNWQVEVWNTTSGDTGRRPIGPPAVGDLDNNGINEVVCYHKSAPNEPKESWVLVLEEDTLLREISLGEDSRVGETGSPAIGDMNFDGTKEILSVFQTGAGMNATHFAHLHEHAGVVVPGWPRVFAQGVARGRPPVIADVDGDNDLEVLVVDATDGRISGWHHTGQMLANFPIEEGANLHSGLIVADLDGDDRPEVVYAGAYVYDEEAVSYSYRLTAREFDGTLLQGFPKTVTGENGYDNWAGLDLLPWGMAAGPLSQTELQTNLVLLITSDSDPYAWDTGYSYSPTRQEWASFHHDAANTRCYEFFPGELRAALYMVNDYALIGSSAGFEAMVYADNTNNLHVYWDFDGDSIFEIDGENLFKVTTHFGTPGDRTITMLVTNTVTGESFTKSKVLHVLNSVAADFSASHTNLSSAPAEVQFSDLSENYPQFWHWDFGDGTTTNVQHPAHVYTAGGTYTVTLTVSNDFGLNGVSSDTQTRTDYIVLGAADATTTNRYVSLSGKHIYPFTTWDKAATNLQMAVDASVDGDHIFVTNGVYVQSSMVYIQKCLSIQSVNGSAATILDGDSGLYSLVSIQTGEDLGAVLDGFTLQNANQGLSVGGATVRNCILRNNQKRGFSASSVEGSVQVEDCLVENNGGGGAWVSGNVTVDRCVFRYNDQVEPYTYTFEAALGVATKLRNCLFYGNTNGGVLSLDQVVEAENLTIVNNDCDHQAVMAWTYSYPLTLRNILCWSNRVSAASEYGDFAVFDDADEGVTFAPAKVYNSCIQGTVYTNNLLNPESFVINTPVEPIFVDYANNDYRLATNSPLIDAGFDFATYAAGASINTVRVDYGHSNYKVAGNWNHINTGTVGTHVANAIDVQSNLTGFTLGIAENEFEGGVYIQGNNADGLYPAAVNRDGLRTDMFWLTGDVPALQFGNLNTACVYAVQLFGSSTMSEYDGIKTVYPHDAAGMAKFKTVDTESNLYNVVEWVELRPDENREILIGVEDAGQHLGCGIISAVEITEYEAVVTYPYTNWLDLSSQPRVQGDGVDVGAYEGENGLKPLASFTATPAEGLPPLEVDFTDTSSSTEGSITNYLWDFGDGAVTSGASLTNPAHTYTDLGLFSATLTIEDDAGLSATASLSIHVAEPLPNAPSSFVAVTTSVPTSVDLSWVDNADDETSMVLLRTPGVEPETLILDNTDASVFEAGSTVWERNVAHGTSMYGASCHRVNSGVEILNYNTVDYFPDFQETFTYNVYLWYPISEDNCPNTLVKIFSRDGEDRCIVDQRENGGQWTYIGTWDFGLDSGIKIDAFNSQQGAYTVADAVKFERTDAYEPLVVLSSNTTQYTDTELATDQRYAYRIAASNEYGFSSWVDAQVTLPTTNLLPTASIDLLSPTSGSPELFVSAIGSGSDPDGTITHYLWNFGDGYSGSIQSGATLTNTSFVYRNIGLYDVTLTVTDNLGYSTTVTNTVNVFGAPPSAPSSLHAENISDLYVAVNWSDNAYNEDNYTLQRQSDGGAFSTLATLDEATDSYDDTTVVFGTTYGYRVRAENENGTSEWSNVGTVLFGDTANFTLPFEEPFEDRDLGSIHGQHGWTGGGTVQTGTVHVGSRALSLQSATASHTFVGAQDDVIVEFQAKFVRGSATPSDTGTAVAIFSIDTNGYLVAYSNETPITLTSTNLSDDWHSFKAQLDYIAQTWDMTVDGELLVDSFAFYSAQSDFQKIAFKSGSQAAFLDEIRVTNNSPDTDNDGIPDTWEDEHYNGITNAIATNLCANGINTILQAYIAGLNPTNATSFFEVSNVRNILQWNGTNGRIYSIYWSSNLLSGDFQPLESNLPWTAMPYTDTNHPGGEQGFYKLEVELEE